MDEFTNEGLDTSLADEALSQQVQPKPERIKHSIRLEDCLQTLDKLEGTRTNEEIERFARTLVALGIFDRSSFGNLEPVGFLKKMMPYIRHEIFASGSALLHINHPQEKACVLVRGKAKEFIPRNAKEIETESKNSLSNSKTDKKISKTLSELNEPDLKQKSLSQAMSLTSIVEENENDTSSPAKKRRFGRPTKLKSMKTSNGNSTFMSLNSLEKPPSAKIQDELLPEFKGSWKSSSKSNNGSIAGTLANLDEEDENEVFMEEFMKYPKNYFIGEVLKVKPSKILSSGSYFGTKSFGRILNAKQAIFAEEECHCITLHRDDYLATLESEKTLHRDKIEFFLNLFPGFNQEAVTEFSLLWDDQLHKRGDTIYQENDEPKCLFIVFNGEITVSKEIIDPLAARRNSDGLGLIKKKNLSPLQIATFCQGYFFGEEFFEKKPRMFTATVSSSKAKILHLSRKDYRAIAKRYSEIFEKIKQMVKLSSKVNSQRLENLLQVHDLDFNREAMQEAFLSQKEYVLKSERTLKTHTKTVSMIMKPTKKPKNINVRLQYDKYFVCKPGQKYPEYLKMVVEGNIKPDPTEKPQQVDSKRLNVPDQQRRLSTPVLRESEDLDVDSNFVSRQGQGHQKTTSLYKMTQLPIPRDDNSSKYNGSAPQTLRVSVNNSVIQSERTIIEDPSARQNYYKPAKTARGSVTNENRYGSSSYDNEPLIATSTMVPLRLMELDPNQRMENGMIYSERKFSKPVKGMTSRYTQREKSQISDYTPMLIKTAQNAGAGMIVKAVPVNTKLMSGQREASYGVVRSLNNLPSTILPQIKYEIKEKLKISENPKMMFMRSPKKKDYGSLNDLNEVLLGQERRSAMNVEVGSLKKL